MKWWLCVGLLFSAGAWAGTPQRVVSLGGSVTEIVYDLGQGARLAADDLSSLYPEAATRLPRVGYYRALPVEGVLSMRPDLVLASEHAGPPLALKRIGDLGIKVETVSDAPSVASLYQRIMQVAKALGVPARGAELVAQTRRDVEQAQALPAVRRHAVLVINRTGQFQGAGRDTAADALLGLAGLDNVLARQQGYKPLSSEGLAALAPDMIVVTRTSVQASGGLAGFLGNPGVAATPAAAAQRIVVMDDLLALGLGPRLALAIRQLKDAAGR